MGAFRCFWIFALFIVITVAFADVQDQKNRQDRKVIFAFKDQELAKKDIKPHSSDKRLSLDTLLRRSNPKHVAKRDTLLFYKNLNLDDATRRENKRRQMVTQLKKDKFRDYFLRRVPPTSQKVKRDTLSGNVDGKMNKQDRKVIFAFKDQQLKKEQKLDTHLRHPFVPERIPEEKRRQIIAQMRKNKLRKLRDAQKNSTVAVGKKPIKKQDKVTIVLFDLPIKNNEKQLFNKHESRPQGTKGALGKLTRERRDLASTVVGAAVSQVVANLMSNKHEKAPEVQKDVYYEPSGNILDAGAVAPISNEIVPRPFAPIKKDNGAPVANEIVPLPFAPFRKDIAHSAPVANEIVPLPFAPIQKDVIPVPHAPIKADVEVIVGNTNSSSTTTTSKPSEEKKGFWSTFWGSIKLFFGTVTNSVGGFFIDIGQRVTSFVENRIKV